MVLLDCGDHLHWVKKMLLTKYRKRFVVVCIGVYHFCLRLLLHRRESLAPASSVVYLFIGCSTNLFIPGFLYDLSNSYQVAFYVAGAIPIIAAVIMFFIPFLMPPPNHSFWLRRSGFSSKQYLIPSSSESLKTDKNEEEGSKTKGVKKCELIAEYCEETNRPVNSRQSFNSMSRFSMDIEKKVSMKDIGSVSSFGSILLSPRSKKKSLHSVSINKSSGLLVVDRVSNV